MFNSSKATARKSQDNGDKDDKMGGMKYIIMILFIVFVVNYTLTAAHNSSLDGFWQIDSGSKHISLVRINKNASYLQIDPTLSKKYNISPYVSINFTRNDTGVVLSKKVYAPNGNLKLDVILYFIKVKDKLILTNSSSFLICDNNKVCSTLTDLKGNAYRPNHSWLRKIIDTFF